MKLFKMVWCVALLGTAMACGGSDNGGNAGGSGGGTGGGTAGGTGGGTAGGTGGGAGGGASGSGYAIGGTISGPSNGVVLSDPGEPDFTFTSNTSAFTFANKVPAGTAYQVTVKSVPSGSGEACAVTDGGTGTVGSTDVASVAIRCTFTLP